MTKQQPGVKAAANPADIAGIENRQYTVAEVAEMFEVTVGQVRIWIRSGQLLASLAGHREGYRISRESLVQFAIRRYS